MDDLRVSQEVKDGIMLVKCEGSIDSDTNYILDKAIKKSISENMPKIIIDLGGTNYINSSGWSVFLMNLRQVRSRGGDIIIINMKSVVKDVFKLLELNELIKSFDYFNNAKDEFDVAHAS